MGNKASSQNEVQQTAQAQVMVTVGTPAVGGAEESKEDEASRVSKMFPLQALFYACDQGDPNLVRRAYDAGADVNTPDNGPERDPTKKEEEDELFKDAVITGDYAMHKAAEKGHVEVVKLLFFLQADVEAKNRLGSTPLHRAISQNKREVVEFLVSKGAKIEATNHSGNNALHIASYLGLVDICKLLLDSRPDAWRLLERTNNAQMTPIDYARKKQVQQLFQTYHKPAPSEPGSVRNSARQLAGYASQSNSKLARAGALASPNAASALAHASAATGHDPTAPTASSPVHAVPAGATSGTRLSVDGGHGHVTTIGGLAPSVEDEKEHEVQAITYPVVSTGLDAPAPAAAEHTVDEVQPVDAATLASSPHGSAPSTEALN